MKRIPFWAVARELFVDTGGVHYVWLGLLTLYTLLKGGDTMEVIVPLLQNNVMIKAVLGLVVICTILLLVIASTRLIMFYKSKSKKAQDDTKRKELEDKVDELKDGIKHREALMTTTADESVRKMLRMQNDADGLTVKDIEHKIDTLLRH